MRLAIVFALLVSVAQAADDPKKVAFLEESAALQAKLLEQLDSEISKSEDLLKRIKKADINTRIKKTTITESGKIVFPSKAGKETETDRLETRLPTLIARRAEEAKLKYRWPDLDTKNLSTGAAGGIAGVKVSQVIDKTNVIVTTSDRVTLWLNVPSIDAADGQWVGFKQAFIATGTRTYETVNGGSKTVYVLKPYATNEAPDEAKE